ncbi:uncharacterized protein BXZ73DRAFT_38839 [Epithele typhae]|uniref:uncharacterized protein n=1 Tax=Epithele typhae TaxID=378194 RepID=UPI0020083D90|nr:uncharacterized protein BXZ73DRAFT_38839 [Epithele typhae]KAH9945184.1 hypothetical protein BXZ73DRAFT_38839 [Epithele typhae]
MAAPLSVITQWLKKTYPRPAVDPEWLEGCYSWIVEELQLDPSRDMKTILENVDTQLLESDFADSMRSGSGIPPNAIGADETMVIKGPILVEVVEIMEVGQSAYSLLQVHESRVEYQKQAQIRTASGDPEEHKPMPKFPRSMLQLRLSDGQHVITAVEHKSLPGIELGETPLGFKVSCRFN